MFLHEIKPGETILLEIIKGDQKNTVNATVFDSKHEILILNPIIIDGKILNLEDAQVNIDILYEQKDEKPLMWKNPSYAIKRINGTPYVFFKSNKESITYNRRTNFRLDLDIQGVLNGREKIIIHDISNKGISFFTKIEEQKNINQPIAIKFINTYGEELFVSGEIIRKDIINERNLYGCKIKSNMQIDKFISEEQRRRMTIRRRQN